MAFQNQFAKKPLTLNDPEGMPVPTGAPKRSKRAQTKETGKFMTGCKLLK